MSNKNQIFLNSQRLSKTFVKSKIRIGIIYSKIKQQAQDTQRTVHRKRNFHKYI